MGFGREGEEGTVGGRGPPDRAYGGARYGWQVWGSGWDGEADSDGDRQWNRCFLVVCLLNTAVVVARSLGPRPVMW